MARLARPLWLTLFLLCLPFCAALSEGSSRALLIGCDRFVTQLDTYPSSRNNVEQMAAVLSGDITELTRLVTRPEGIASVDELSRLVEEAYAGASEDDVSYFYISTHGLWESGLPGGDMRFVLSDGESEGSVTAYELRAMFDLIPGTKVLIMDACHSGASIGKGVNGYVQNVFAAPEYKILCSSGGAEESWFWSGRSERVKTGAGYFSGALVNALSPSGGYGADDNHDGIITLTELKRYLLLNHGASTVQTYPEEDDFAILTYDRAAAMRNRRASAVENVSFEDGALSADNPTIAYTFTVLRDVRVAYQLVFQKNGRWDFDNAQLIWDSSERFGVHGDTPGYLSPGYKEGEITFTPNDSEEAYGYVLLQMLTVSPSGASVVASRVLCVPPSVGDPSLSAEVRSRFHPAKGEELSIVIRHSLPCELTITVEDEQGQTVRRLASREPSRPQQLRPKGTFVTWNGLTTSGETAAPGIYRVHVKGYLGGEVYETYSAEVVVEE